MSDFVPFCLTPPQPPQKLDIINGCSLTLSQLLAPSDFQTFLWPRLRDENVFLHDDNVYSWKWLKMIENDWKFNQYKMLNKLILLFLYLLPRLRSWPSKDEVTYFFALPGNRTIAKIVLIRDWFSTKNAIYDFWNSKVPLFLYLIPKKGDFPDFIKDLCPIFERHSKITEVILLRLDIKTFGLDSGTRDVYS